MIVTLRTGSAPATSSPSSVGPDEAWRPARDVVEIDVRSEGNARGVKLEDRRPASPVRRLQRHATVEPARPGERGVEDLGPVGGREDDHTDAGLEPVHLREDLVERLLLFVVAPEPDARAAAPADGVQLVDEDDRGCGLARLLEQVTDARCADTDDGLHELRSGLAEERHLGFARHSAREEGLASTRRSDEQDALRDPTAKPLVLLWFLEEIDHLLQLLFDLVDPGHVGKGRSGTLCVVDASAALAEGAEQAA